MLKKSLLTVCLLGIFSVGVVGQQSSTPIQGTAYEDPSPAAEQWSNRGVDLFQQGDVKKAIEYFYEAWKLDPSSANQHSKNLSSAYNNYAKELSEQGKIEEALQNARRAVFFNEENSTAQKNLDLLYKNQGNNPDSKDYRLTQARALRKNGFVEEAVADYLKVVALSTKSSKQERLQVKAELAQVYQLLYGKYSETPVGKARFQKMVALIKEIHAEDNTDPRPHILLGRAYLVSGDLKNSIESFENALKLDDTNKLALDGLVQAWKKVIEVSPEQSVNLMGYGNALIRAGYNTEGQQYLDKANKQASHNNQQVSDASNPVNNSSYLSKDNEGVLLASKGFAAHQRGDLDGAIKLYQEALKKFPPSPEASDIYYNLGSAYEEKQNFTYAEDYFIKALKINPANDLANRGLDRLDQKKKNYRTEQVKQAIALQEKGKALAAIESYKKLLEVFPHDAEIHFNLGTAFQQAEQVAKALYEYEAAYNLDPSNQDYLNAVTSLKRAVDTGFVEKSKSNLVLKEALKLQTEGKTVDSLKKYQEAIALYPQNAQAHFNYATALHTINKAEEAIREYQVAYELAGEQYSESLYFMAVLYESIGDMHEALKNYRLYLDKYPQGEYFQPAQEKINELHVYR